LKSIFSVDVEDWFHLLDLPAVADMNHWPDLPSRVEKNFLALMAIFAESNVHVTCFFLGWIAQRHPHLVREAERLGHEVASHGFGHQLVHRMSPKDFYRDISFSKQILEDLVGHSILGYRAPGFSATRNTPWFFDQLIRAGYRYDSSIFPATRNNGGIPNFTEAPHLIRSRPEWFIEFPITVREFLSRRFCFFGGGYFRFYPLPVIKKMAARVLEEGRPVVFYLHPREIDPDQPRLPMSLRRKFKTYLNLKTTASKLRGLLSAVETTTFQSFIECDLAPLFLEQSTVVRTQ